MPCSNLIYFVLYLVRYVPRLNSSNQLDQDNMQGTIVHPYKRLWTFPLCLSIYNADRTLTGALFLTNVFYLPMSTMYCQLMLSAAGAAHAARRGRSPAAEAPLTPVQRLGGRRRRRSARLYTYCIYVLFMTPSIAARGPRTAVIHALHSAAQIEIHLANIYTHVEKKRPGASAEPGAGEHPNKHNSRGSASRRT